MCKVNIYIETSIHGPAVKNGAYGYVIEYQKKSGGIETREEFENMDNTTEKRLILTALCSSLRRLTKPCSVLVFIGCEWIRRAYENDWVQKWRENNWKNIKGDEVRNADLWQQLDELTQYHYLEFANQEDDNTFSEWIKGEISTRHQENAINTSAESVFGIKKGKNIG